MAVRNQPTSKRFRFINDLLMVDTLLMFDMNDANREIFESFYIRKGNLQVAVIVEKFVNIAAFHERKQISVFSVFIFVFLHTR